MEKQLKKLAKNLWWSWNNGEALWESIYGENWEKNKNPIACLGRERNGWQKAFKPFWKRFNKYVEQKPNKKPLIAYLCAEFGIHKCLPFYSGGLGVLAGDTLKEASDMKLNFVGVGLAYRHGYFTQKLTENGQKEIFERLNFEELPMENTNKSIEIKIGGKRYSASIWKVEVGRVPLYLLYSPEITGYLYEPEPEKRIRQEMLLGIGGALALKELGIEPDIWHLNEGHPVFCCLERSSWLIEKGFTFEEALQNVRKSSVFTTHTPVPAGNDAFEKETIRPLLEPYLKEKGLDFEKIYNLAKDKNGLFNLTVLAINLTGVTNAVSKKHQEVSKNLWFWVWKKDKPEDAPVTYVTNGVHLPTWQNKKIAKAVKNLEKLWEAHMEAKRKLIEFIKNRLPDFMPQPQIDLDTLLIGFARRFATYKRADLIFEDTERLSKIIKQNVALIFAGKAHPADEKGKALISKIISIALQEPFKGKIIILENYDMEVAKQLVTGVDVWLNNPKPPLEASGTSGQKAAANGVLNLSVADGWWIEGYNGINGWVFENTAGLYELIEKEILPKFRRRNKKGIPQEWVQMMQESIKSISPYFNTRRMLKEYFKRVYSLLLK